MSASASSRRVSDPTIRDAAIAQLKVIADSLKVLDVAGRFVQSYPDSPAADSFRARLSELADAEFKKGRLHEALGNEQDALAVYNRVAILAPQTSVRKGGPAGNRSDPGPGDDRPGPLERRPARCRTRARGSVSYIPSSATFFHGSPNTPFSGGSNCAGGPPLSAMYFSRCSFAAVSPFCSVRRMPSFRSRANGPLEKLDAPIDVVWRADVQKPEIPPRTLVLRVEEECPLQRFGRFARAVLPHQHEPG